MKKKPFTNAQFAQRAAALAAHAVSWARDALDDADKPANLARVETFCEEVAERCDWLEEAAFGKVMPH